MTLHAGLTYSIIVQSFSRIPLTVTLVETEYDNNNNNDNNNNKKKKKMKNCKNEFSIITQWLFVKI